MKLLSLESNLEQLTSVALWGIYMYIGIIILSIAIIIGTIIWYKIYSIRHKDEITKLNSKMLHQSNPHRSKWQEKIQALEKQNNIKNK
jgi:cell division protein FtsL